MYPSFSVPVIRPLVYRIRDLSRAFNPRTMDPKLRTMNTLFRFTAEIERQVGLLPRGVGRIDVRNQLLYRYFHQDISAAGWYLLPRELPFSPPPHQRVLTVGAVPWSRADLDALAN